MGHDAMKVGNYWAAIRNDEVIAVISMRIPNELDFDSYREKARECLAVLSEDIKTGEVIQSGDKRVFVVRPNHPNRSKSKTPKKPKIYKMASHLI